MFRWGCLEVVCAVGGRFSVNEHYSRSPFSVQPFAILKDIAVVLDSYLYIVFKHLADDSEFYNISTSPNLWFQNGFFHIQVHVVFFDTIFDILFREAVVP